ncbi:MAG: GIY-YIG nuclease family protein [Lacipirellulaceae bacterium]
MTFGKLSDQRPGPPTTTPSPPSRRPLEYAAVVCVWICVLAGSAAVLNGLAGDAVGAALIGLVAIAVGIVPMVAYATVRADKSRAQQDAKQLRAAIDDAVRSSMEAVTKWERLKAEFNRIVADEREVLNRDREANERRIAGERDVLDFAKAENARRTAEERERLRADFQRMVTDERAALNLARAENERRISEETSKVLSEVATVRANAAQLFNNANERKAEVDRLGSKLFDESAKLIRAKMTARNYPAQKEKLRQLIASSREREVEVSEASERQLLESLDLDYGALVRREFEREEQNRIKAQIREEQRAEREIEQQRKRVEAEQRAVEKALSEALARAHGEHSAEVDMLRQKLAEAEARSERAKSMAQLTKAGHIYVVSNLGAFGDGVYKVGMTRRLEPLDRVKELGDASVPFPFDVHMMISCNDAPRLENLLHRALHFRRLNRVNLRKEFFRADLDTIHRLVVENHGEVEYVADPEALEYRETQTMSDAEFAELTAIQEAVGVFAGDDDEVEAEPVLD